MTKLPPIDEIGIGQPSEQPFVQLIYETVVRNKIRVAAEIGTGLGTFTQALLKGLEKTDGQLISCDPVLRHNVDHPRLFYFKVTSNKMFYMTKGYFGLVLIDGDHSAAQVREDVLNCLPRCSPGAVVILHDIHVSQFPGIHRVWNVLKECSFVIQDIRAFPGMGVAKIDPATYSLFYNKIL